MRSFAAYIWLIIVLAAAANPARASAPTIVVDGSVVRTDVPALVVDGHVLVPLRGVLERFGALVGYDARRNVATAQRGGISVDVAIGTSNAWIDGKHVTLETAARELAGRVEVPLRFIAESLGVSVDYDDLTNTVIIVSGFKPGNFVAAGPGTPSLGRTASAYEVPTQNQVPPTVEDERPSPNSLVGSQYPQVYARFSGGASPVDPASVRISVDGIDVTDAATVSSAYVAYTPSVALETGTHDVRVSGQAEDGASFDEQWSFRIDSGYSATYVSSMIGFGPSAFGVPRFGFFPPGFSVFAPGPQFFVEDEPIIIVFFSPFFPNGTGFFSLSGFPGQFVMTPWLGCPGFFWSEVTVPFGINDPVAVVAAHFTTADGRVVVVHSTAPLHIDGRRRARPADLRFAVMARLVNRPATPRVLVAFHRIIPIVGRLKPTAPNQISRTTGTRVTRAMQIVPRAATPEFQRSAIVIPVVHAASQLVPARPVVPIVHATQPQPVIVPIKPIPPQ